MPKRKVAELNDDEVSSKKSNNITESLWHTIDNGNAYAFIPEDVKYTSSVAAFDIDGTIITTQSGKVFPKDENDWRFLYPSVPGKLNDCTEMQDRAVVFFTNQKGISTGKQPLKPFQKKIEAIVSKLRVPVRVFVSAGGTSRFRKPYLGMWWLFEEKFNDGKKVDLKSSVFVGDAAGRPAKDKIKKDFSCSDRLFAKNLGIPFKTPEEFFNNAATDKNYNMPKFDPQNFVDNGDKVPFLVDNVTNNEVQISDDAGTPDLIIMVGAPASGKSHFVQQHILPLKYNYISRDKLKTWQKCVAAMEEALKEGKNVVIDNTNPDIESRKRYIDAARKANKNVKVRIFVMNVPKEHCEHNNRYRLIKGTDAAHLEVNSMVMNMHWSKYQAPDAKKEGLDTIITVNPRPHFKNKDDRTTYSMYLVEGC